MSELKLKYLNRTYAKVSSKMYDYNCDVKLVVGTETFKAHRDVLVNASDYFSAMFTHDMRERQDDVIRLQEVSPRGFAAMIECVASVVHSITVAEWLYFTLNSETVGVIMLLIRSVIIMSSSQTQTFFPFFLLHIMLNLS